MSILEQDQHRAIAGTITRPISPSTSSYRAKPGKPPPLNLPQYKGNSIQSQGPLKEGAKRFVEVIVATSTYDFMYRKVFHPIFGRFGYDADGQPSRYRDFEAVAASMDGGGGFEMNDRHLSTVDAMLSCFKTVVGGFYKDFVNLLQGIFPGR